MVKNEISKIVKPKLTISSVSISILAILVVLSTIVVFQRVSDLLKNNSAKDTKQNFPIEAKKNKEELPNWVTYRNTEFGFSLKTPSFLTKDEVRNQAQYISFIKLNKTQASLGDSVYIGISKSNFDQEVDNIKNSISSDSGQRPSSERNVVVSGLNAKILFYSETDNSEERSLLIINGGNITISISSTSEQIEVIKDTFILAK